MAKIYTLTWYFYKPIYIINAILTAICVWDIYAIGMWFLGYTFLIKMVGYAATIAYKNYFANKTYMFFRNAGYSITRMYFYSFGFDMLVYISLIITFSLTIHGFAHVKG